MATKPEKTQRYVDAYYKQHGPCCAGCDWWRFNNSVVGECTKSPPVSADEAARFIGMNSCSIKGSAGHVMTKRDHICGDFIDTYDWNSEKVND